MRSFSFDFSRNLRSTSDSTLNGGQPLYTFNYDDLDRTTEQVARYLPAPAGMNRDRTLSVSYDRFENLRLRTLTDLSQTLIQTFEFDRADRLKRSLLPSGIDAQFNYLADDFLREVMYGSTIRQQFDYHPDGLAKSIRLLRGTSQQVFEITQTPSADDAITKIEEELAGPTPNTTYTYDFDALGRLSQAGYSGPLAVPASQTFAYDPFGNVEDPTDPNVFGYDANERRIRAPGGVIRRFDADNNLTEIELPSGQKVLSTYDAEGEQTSIRSEATGVSAQFDHDPFGRRIRQTVSGKTTWFLWEGDRLVAEYDGATGQRVVRYEYLERATPAAVAYRPASGGAESVFTTLFDDEDSARVLVDAAGTIVWRGAYPALGRSKVDSDPDRNGQPIFFRFREMGAVEEDFELFLPGTPLLGSLSPSKVDAPELVAPPRMLFAYHAPSRADSRTADPVVPLNETPGEAGSGSGDAGGSADVEGGRLPDLPSAETGPDASSPRGSRPVFGAGPPPQTNQGGGGASGAGPAVGGTLGRNLGRKGRRTGRRIAVIFVDTNTLDRILRPGASSQEIRDILSEAPPPEQCPPNSVSAGGGGCVKNPFLDPEDFLTDEELEEEISKLERETLIETGVEVVQTIIASRRGPSRMSPPRAANTNLKKLRRLKRLEKLRKKIERRRERRKRQREEPQVKIRVGDKDVTADDVLNPPQRTGEMRQPPPLEQQLPKTIERNPRAERTEQRADFIEMLKDILEIFSGGGGGGE